MENNDYCITHGCFFLAPQVIFSQIISESAAVKANFGIDADLYANYHNRVPTLNNPNGTSDWFQNYTNWPGSGEGVIDQTNAASLKASIQGNNNFSFVKRMSKPKMTVVNGNTWIDAVYVRDNNSIGGNKDATVFTSTKDKNDDNPSTWSLGSGGTPPKDDIIDAFGHMRIGANGDVWGVGGMAKIADNGVSHTDFEFFAAKISLNSAGTALIGLGPDAGHTAWRFDSTGNVTTAGDLLVVVNFINGGTVPVFEVKVWIADADRVNFNTKVNRPFNLTGDFFSGLNANGFGYAGIEAKNISDTSVWAVVNIGATPILGAPWGVLEGSKAEYSDNIHQFEFMEFAINLTTLGLQGVGGAGCDKTLGTLLIKTRSSQTFTSELKDFVGPFLFGFEIETNVDVQNLSSCEIEDTGAASFDLNDAVTNAYDGNISFYITEADAQAKTNVIANPSSVSVTIADSPKTFWARSESQIDPTCFTAKSFTVTVYDNPDLVVTDSEQICDGESVDLSTLVTNADGGTVTYHTSQADAMNDTNALVNSVVSPGIGQTTYWVRSENPLSTNCYNVKSIVIPVEPCVDVLCTYTQGFYGNPVGMACSPDGMFSILDLIKRSIQNMGGVLYLGRGTSASDLGGSLTIPYANAQTIINIMPGIGAAAVLATDYNQSSLPPLKNGRLNNGLLSQTIALALNLYMVNDNPLGDFVLEGNKYLVTVKKSKTSSCLEPAMADCLVDPTAINSWWIPAKVVNALPAPKDVWSLFQMAKDAFGGATLPTGVKLSDINMVVDAINNAFDNCSYFKYYSVEKEMCPVIEPVIAVEPTATTEVRIAETDPNYGFEVFPVPFDNALTIRYKFDYKSNVRIELFDGFGNLKLSKTDTECYFNKEIPLNINISIVKDQMYYIKLTTDRENVVKKIISSK